MFTRRTAMSLMAMGGIGVTGCQSAIKRPLLSSDTHPRGYPTVEAVEYMGKLLSQETNGRLDIRVYAGGQLGSERDTLEITSFGGLDMNRVHIGPLNAIEPLTIIPSLPFLFQSTEHLRATLDGDVGEAILEGLKPHNLVGLCFYDSGQRSFYNTKRPILTPEDMEGMKFRVMNSDLNVNMVRNLGADPTPMSLGEVYQALVQGVIDGAENNWPSYQSGRHFETAQYYSLTRHSMAPEVLVMSLSRWNKLSETDQKLIKRAAKESVTLMRTLWDKRVEDSKDTLVKAGIEVNEVKDLSAFRDRMKPVWDMFVTSDLQKKLLADTLKIGESLRG